LTPRSDPSGPRRKTILLPTRDEQLERFLEAESPVPVEVVSDPATPLGPFDLALLVVASVGPGLRATVTRVIEDGIPYAVLIRRDLWGAADHAIHGVFDEIQRDPRRKLIRFWRTREDLEQLLRDEVFALDDVHYAGQALRDGTFVKVGSSFEQTWELENTGFCTWDDRTLKEVAGERLVPNRTVVPVAHTAPGERVDVTVRFRAPDGPTTCLSVWQLVTADGRIAFPWTPGVRCQVLAVL
jgi:hypothetical protein